MSQAITLWKTHIINFFLENLKDAIESKDITQLHCESTCFICLHSYPNIVSLNLHINMIHPEIQPHVQYYITNCFTTKFLQLANMQSAYIDGALPSICATHHTIQTPMLQRMSLPLLSLKIYIYNFYEAMINIPSKTQIMTNDQFKKVNSQIMSLENRVIGLATETPTNSSKAMGGKDSEIEGLLSIINLVLSNWESFFSNKNYF